MYVPSNTPKYICYECRNKIPVVDLEAVYQEQLRGFFSNPQEIAAYLNQTDAVINEKKALIQVLEQEQLPQPQGVRRQLRAVAGACAGGGDYLATSLNVPEARVHVEGRGSDEPVNQGKDAASLAANRRVEIVIEGSRFEANAPLELVKASGEPQKRRHRRCRAARSGQRAGQKRKVRAA